MVRVSQVSRYDHITSTGLNSTPLNLTFYPLISCASSSCRLLLPASAASWLLVPAFRRLLSPPVATSCHHLLSPPRAKYLLLPTCSCLPPAASACCLKYSELTSYSLSQYHIPMLQVLPKGSYCKYYQQVCIEKMNSIRFVQQYTQTP